MKIIKNKKAFTLIEIIIAIIIIGGLAAMGLTNSSKPIDESKVVKAQSEVSVLEIAINQYNIDNPTATITTYSDSNITLLINGGYLQRKPAYSGQFGCTYGYDYVTNNGVTSTSKHVTLSSCTFNNGTTISVY